MSKAAVKKKKRWSKKKKAAVIILSVLCALIVLTVAAGVIALNWYCRVPEYNVVQTNQHVSLIAHRGMSSMAPENTTASFEQAGKHYYWGAECDVYRTADGVWIVSHDTNTYRMMDKTANIEKKSYAELMEMNVDNGANIDEYPDLKMCSLEDYLKICKQYNMVPIIELKGKNNTEHYDEITALVSKYELEAQYISFHFENLQKIRELTDAPVFYLVQKIEQEDIDLALTLKDCGISFNGNKEENYEVDESGANMIGKCAAAELPLASWTIDDPDVLARLVENGVTTITTNAIKY